MRPLSRREMIVVIGGVAAGLLLVLYVFVFLPRLTTLAQVNRLLHAKIAQIADAERIAARLPAARREHDLTKAHLLEIERQIPGSIEIPKLVADLNRAMQASGVQLVEIAFSEAQQASPTQGSQPAGQAPSTGQRPGEPPPGAPAAAGPEVAGLQPFPFSMRIRGTFDQTVTFLEQVEAMPRIVAVETLGISEGSLSLGPGRTGPPLDISLGMKTFALR